MDWLKKMIIENMEIVLTVVVSVSVVAVYQLFFKEGSLFETFTKEVLDFGMQTIRNQFSMPE